jgi:hypothetical protein
MQVKEKLVYDEYWRDPRFKEKQPVMNGSKRHNYGDNIYYRESPDASFIQKDSHHSLPNGKINELNYNRDLQCQYVLISNKYWYFGVEAIDIPKEFLSITNVKRFHKINNDKDFIYEFSVWLLALPKSGYIAKPCLFKKKFMRYSGKQ